MEEMRLICDYKEMIKVVPQMEKNLEIYEDPFVFLINGEPVVVGELEIWNKGKEIYIKNINSLEMRKGYGKTFIQFLLRQMGVREIVGEAIPDAIPFWFKMGAKFQEDLFEHFTQEEVLESHFLLPFTISA